MQGQKDGRMKEERTIHNAKKHIVIGFKKNKIKSNGGREGVIVRKSKERK